MNCPRPEGSHADRMDRAAYNASKTDSIVYALLAVAEAIMVLATPPPEDTKEADQVGPTNISVTEGAEPDKTVEPPKYEETKEGW